MTNGEPPESNISASPPVVDASSSDSGARDKKVERRYALIMALITGAVAIGGGIAGSELQINGAARTQAMQFVEQRSIDERTKKADVYFAFLDSANKYAVATVNVRDCITKARDAAAASGAKVYSLDSFCVKNISDLAPDRFDFQGARNKVYVYGSQAAEDQAGRIAGYLPNSLDSDPVTGLPPFDDRLISFNQEILNRMYQDFETLICIEVPAEPRPHC